MNMEDWNRIEKATSTPGARDKAIKQADVRNKINDLRSSFTKSLSNNISSTNASMSVLDIVDKKNKKPTIKSADDNMDDLLNKIGLTVQRKGGY